DGKCKSREYKNSEQCKKCLTKACEYKSKKKVLETPKQRKELLNQEKKKSVKEEQKKLLAKSNRKLLKKFQTKINKFKNKLCLMCNEYFPLIKLVKNEYCYCYCEKTIPKKFSDDNNMDPGNIPEELQDLTKVEKMLIAQIFLVISIYRLRGGSMHIEKMLLTFSKM
ncbi:27104_t:CDS:2, partial [Gigaspora margarita]